MKRQKFHAKFKKMKRELIPKNEITHDLQSTVTQQQSSMEVHQMVFGGEPTYLRTINFRCLSQIHQLLIASIPHIPLSAESHTDLSQLTYELLRTVNLLRKPIDTPTSPRTPQ